MHVLDLARRPLALPFRAPGTAHCRTSPNIGTIRAAPSGAWRPIRGVMTRAPVPLRRVPGAGPNDRRKQGAGQTSLRAATLGNRGGQRCARNITT
jgi:hypothetical protein